MWILEDHRASKTQYLLQMPWIRQAMWEEFFQAAMWNVAGQWSKIDFLRTLSYVFYKHNKNILWQTFIGLNVGEVIHPNVQLKVLKMEATLGLFFTLWWFGSRFFPRNQFHALVSEEGQLSEAWVWRDWAITRKRAGRVRKDVPIMLKIPLVSSYTYLYTNAHS